MRLLLAEDDRLPGEAIQAGLSVAGRRAQARRAGPAGNPEGKPA